MSTSHSGLILQSSLQPGLRTPSEFFPRSFRWAENSSKLDRTLSPAAYTTNTLVAETNFDVELASRAWEVQEFEQSSENNQNCKRNWTFKSTHSPVELSLFACELRQGWWEKLYWNWITLKRGLDVLNLRTVYCWHLFLLAVVRTLKLLSVDCVVWVWLQVDQVTRQ